MPLTRRQLAPAACAGLLLLAAAPAAPPPGARLTLLPDAEARWVPFTLTEGNQIRFETRLDGRPLAAVLDTGVSYSILSRRFALRHRVVTRGGGEATAIGGTVSIGWTGMRHLRIGGLVRTGGSIGVAALPEAATGGADGVDLLVGRDLLAGHALDIDFAARRFRLIASGRLPFRGATAPLAVSATRLVYVGELVLGPVRLRPMVVDTGDGSAITVTRAGWRAAAPDVPTTSALSYGLAGVVESDLGIVPEVRTGSLVAREVEVRIEPPGGFSEAIGAAGRIGTGFLQQYRVLLDPGAGRMVLDPGPGAARPPLRSTSGLLVEARAGRLRVVHVMRGGPAEGAWRVGDTICAIDGTAVPRDYQADPVARWSVGAPGRTVRLGLCDGSSRTLTLRRFY